jgi:NADPH:quinone reductase-like Zn-dependent oxidoreductase
MSHSTSVSSKAWVLVKNGTAEKAFSQQTIELPPLKDDEVLIDSEAFGLNYADVMARIGLYRDAPPLPAVLGYEIVGRIEQVGKQISNDWIGKRVLAFSRFGGYGQKVITHQQAFVEVGNEAAETLMAICTQAVTAFYMAEYLVPVRKNENVLIHAAAGGVGTILIQLCKMRGAKVFAKIGNTSKTSLVESLGADEVIDYSQEHYAEKLKRTLKGQKLDVSFNPVGGSTYKTDYELLGAGGRMILFGGSELSNGKWGVLSALNFLRKMGLILPVKLMMTSKNILGVNMLRIADQKPEVLKFCLKEVVKLFQAGQLTPIVGGVYSSSQLPQAHEELASGKSTGKLTVRW